MNGAFDHPLSLHRKYIFGKIRFLNLRTFPLTMDARWFVFKPKILFWVNFGGSYIGKC
jgi:hypothetical protein